MMRFLLCRVLIFLLLLIVFRFLIVVFLIFVFAFIIAVFLGLCFWDRWRWDDFQNTMIRNGHHFSYDPSIYEGTPYLAEPHDLAKHVLNVVSRLYIRRLPVDLFKPFFYFDDNIPPYFASLLLLQILGHHLRFGQCLKLVLEEFQNRRAF